MSSYPNLPDDVIEDILYRAPVKTVGRCRCLSKQWRSALSRPDFITTHLNWSKLIRPESLLLVLQPTVSGNQNKRRVVYHASWSNAHHLFDKVTIYAKPLKAFDKHGFGGQVLGSCDGLLLVPNRMGKLSVWNPITNEATKVPDPPNRPLFPDDQDCVIFSGLGYDDVGGEYKVVTIFDNMTEHAKDIDFAEMFVYVFSLKTGKWNKAESSPICYHSVVPFCSPMPFINGCIHWFSMTTDLKPTIVAFDMAQEKFLQVSPPFSPIDPDWSDQYFGNGWIGFIGLMTLDECLCAFNATTKDIWVMKEYGVAESWTKLMVNDHDVLKTTIPICMLGQETMVFKDSEKLLVYNLKEHTVNDIVVGGMGCNIFNVASFVESLVSPYGANETTRE